MRETVVFPGVSVGPNERKKKPENSFNVKVINRNVFASESNAKQSDIRENEDTKFRKIIIRKDNDVILENIGKTFSKYKRQTRAIYRQ